MHLHLNIFMKKEYTGKNGSHTTIEIRKATLKEGIASGIALVAIAGVIWHFIR